MKKEIQVLKLFKFSAYKNFMLKLTVWIKL